MAQDREKKSGSKKDVSDVECYNCGIVRHYANKCPHKIEKKQRADSDEDDEARFGHVTWADTNAAFTTYQVNSVSDGRFADTELVLDNGADVSIVRPSLLRNIMPVQQAIKINGVGGHQFTVKETGFLDPFFSVYASPHTNANVLSFAQVEDMYPITYEPQSGFTVHLPQVDMKFNRKDGMYVADWAEYKHVLHSTVYTKAEEERAKSRVPDW